jgi:transcriptional regulator GlxA family with amidase domain
VTLVAIPLFPRFTALDAVGPYEVLQRMPSIDVVFPGGIGTRELIHDDAIRAWLQRVHPNTKFTTSVCTGALLLAAAGLLDGLTATTPWRAVDLLNELGAHYVPERVVEHLPRRIITAAGVSSGIDMALRLVELLVDGQAAQAAQLLIEYDPQPPFHSGALAKATEATVARANEYLQARQ